MRFALPYLGVAPGEVLRAQIDEDGANKAMLMAADLYREAAASKGLVDEEALKAAFDEVVTADKEGRLGEVLPELDQVNKAAAMDAEAAAAEGGVQ